MFDRLGKWFLKRSLGAQLFLGLGAALLLWLAWATVGVRIVLWHWTGSWSKVELSSLGQVGDLFGGINALFAAFAFVGVALAAYYQYRTFKLQAAQIAHQSFEPLFFELLRRHSLPVNLWPQKTSSVPHSFPQAVQMFRSELAQTPPFVDAQKGAAISDHHIVPPYVEFYRLNEDVLGPYFRKLYHIFKFIAYSQLPWEDKARYASIARAGLNSDELLLLAVNCRTHEGRDFLPFVEGFGLLRHVSHRVGEATPDELIVRSLYTTCAVEDTDGRVAYWKQHPQERPEWAR